MFFALGTVHTVLAPHGRVWFTGQLVGFLCVALAYLAALGLEGRPAFALAGLALGGALLTRNHLVLAGLWPGIYLLVRYWSVNRWRLLSWTLTGLLPILIAVLVTGTMLTVRAWPLTPLHVLKVATSLASVGSALVCVGWVFQRRRIEDVNVLLGFRRRIWTLAAVAAVFATPALYLGLVYFRQ